MNEQWFKSLLLVRAGVNLFPVRSGFHGEVWRLKEGGGGGRMGKWKTPLGVVVVGVVVGVLWVVEGVVGVVGVVVGVLWVVVGVVGVVGVVVVGVLWVVVGVVVWVVVGVVVLLVAGDSRVVDVVGVVVEDVSFVGVVVEDVSFVVVVVVVGVVVDVVVVVKKSILLFGVFGFVSGKLFSFRSESFFGSWVTTFGGMDDNENSSCSSKALFVLWLRVFMLFVVLSLSSLLQNVDVDVGVGVGVVVDVVVDVVVGSGDVLFSLLSSFVLGDVVVVFIFFVVLCGKCGFVACVVVVACVFVVVVVGCDVVAVVCFVVVECVVFVVFTKIVFPFVS